VSASNPTTGTRTDSNPTTLPRPARRRSGVERPREGQVRIRLGALGLSALGVQAIGRVEAVGPEAAGFAPGDRVAYQFSSATPGLSHIVGERDLIGFPKDVAIEKAAALLPLGLVARAIVKQLHSVGRGNRVSVASDPSGADAFVCAWAEHLGAIIVPEGSAGTDVAVTAAAARMLRNSHGVAQLAASDVFQAVRGGVFDGLAIASYPLSDAAKAKSAFEERSSGPVVLLAA
jgi:NADPH:quinone reductase-like Zn-dependent oxidoreductase